MPRVKVSVNEKMFILFVLRICCGSFFVESQDNVHYILSSKKQRLINQLQRGVT